MNIVSLIGLSAAFLTTAAYIPQAYKTIKTKSTDDLSILTYTMLLMGTILWFFYGWNNLDIPIILANGITSILAGIILYLKIISMIRKKNQKKIN